MADKLPPDVWIVIAKEATKLSGRNSALSLQLINKDINSSLRNSASVWKEIVLQHYPRLFDHSKEDTLAALTAASWQRLLSAISCTGVLENTIPVPQTNQNSKYQLKWLGLFEADPTPTEEDPDSSLDRIKLGPETIYQMSIDTNTASFWFSHVQSRDGRPLDVKIGDMLNADPMRQYESGEYYSVIEDEELLSSFASLFPAHSPTKELCVAHCVIRPEYIAPSVESSVLESLSPSKMEEKRKIGCYRYILPPSSLSVVEYSSNLTCHILLPMQDPEKVGFNEERIKFYQDQMRQGMFPTAVGVGRLIRKYRLGHKQYGATWRNQNIFVSMIVDGHHKLEAAARLGWPIGLLMFSPASDYSVVETLQYPIPSWPFNQLEINRYLVNKPPYVLMFDNWFQIDSGQVSPTQQAAILERLVCQGRPSKDVIERIIAPSLTRRWRNRSHGGFIQFVSFKAMCSAFNVHGAVEQGLGPLVLQITSQMSNEMESFRYDPTHPKGILAVDDDGEDDN